MRYTAKTEECKYCDGTGVVTNTPRNKPNAFRAIDCMVCGGKGSIVTEIGVKAIDKSQFDDVALF